MIEASAIGPELRKDVRMGPKTVPSTAWDSESAAEAGRKSGEVRRRRRELTPEERAFDAIDAKLGDLTKELLSAALGQGDFSELKLETRVSALKTLMEWRLGKAASLKPQPASGAAPQEDAVPAAPEDLFA